MQKMLLCATAVLGLGAVLCARPAELRAAEKPKVFALVPKLVGVPFYADVEAGCKEEAKKINAECLFTGPTQADEAEQVRVIRDLITRGVAGIGIAPNNPESVASAIVAAQAKGIPIITFDSDAPKSKRTSFVGTNNLEGGEAGGKAFKAALPNGGSYAIITGGLAADNLNERIKGFRGTIGSGFKEVAGSPYPCDDDSSKGVQLIQDILAKNPNLSGIFFSGGWPMFAPEAYTRALRSRADDIKSGKFVVVSFDVQEPQLRLLKAGLATALVGQRPRAMGAQSMDVLNKLSDKQSVPAVVDTGVDLVDAKNIDEFLKK
jgi:ribose transport system substrate-binding protein